MDPRKDLARMEPGMAVGIERGFELGRLHRAEIGARVRR